ncbi:MAG: hypothetical protein RLZZ272_827 [Actinomycetota bacterium]
MMPAPRTEPPVEPPRIPTTPLPLTGERTVPDVPEETYWFSRHVAAYRFVVELAREHDVTRLVDAGCGEGYGLGLLAEGLGIGAVPGTDAPRTIVGLELDPRVAAHARQRYGVDPAVTVIEAELGAIPLPGASVDLVTLLQVIEHLHDVARTLDELVRLVRPDGTLVVSTPNRRTFSPGDAPPTNPFHVREFAPDELADTLVAAGLVLQRQLGLHHGPRLARLERAHGTTLHAALTTAGPEAWPSWLAEVVPTVTPDDFELREGRPGSPALEDALDLVVVARVQRRDGT